MYGQQQPGSQQYGAQQYGQPAYGQSPYGAAQYRPPMQQSHSGLGLTSFVLSILASIVMFAVFVVAGIMETSRPGGLDEESPAAVLIGLGLIADGGLLLLALGLGVGALFQTSRKRLFAILGVVFSAGTLLLTAGLMVLGAVAE